MLPPIPKKHDFRDPTLLFWAPLTGPLQESLRQKVHLVAPFLVDPHSQVGVPGFRYFLGHFFEEKVTIFRKSGQKQLKCHGKGPEN